MRDKGMVLILWANYFDEVAATALAIAFRKSGIRVKLVGLVPGAATGASGLTLVPDVTLEQAISIADRAAVVVIPGSAGAVRHLDNDPRIRELLNRAQARRAMFITSTEASNEVANLIDHSSAPPSIVPHPAGLAVAEFADSLVKTLTIVSQEPTWPDRLGVS